MATRKAISKKARFEIFKRDGFSCLYCGATPPAAILQVDHVHAVANGGSNDAGNLVTSCQNCNLGKGATPLGLVPRSLSAMAAETKEREAQVIGYTKVMRDQKKRREQDCWDVANTLLAAFSCDSIRRDWFRSIGNFVDKLGVVAVVDAMEIATERKYTMNAAFHYFCGVCWNRINKAGKL